MDPVREQLQQAAARVGVGTYSRHVLLCTGPKCCTPEEGGAAWEALKAQLRAHGLDAGANACYRSKVGCLRICCHGPTMVVYPDGAWYYGMTAERVVEFVRSHLVRGEPLNDWVFARNPLSIPALRQQAASGAGS